MRDGPTEQVLREVGRAASAEAGGTPAELLDGYLPMLVQAAATGARLTRAERERCHERGREAAGQGVAFAAVVDLYLSAARLVWPRLPVLARQVTGARPAPSELVGVGTAVLRTADEALASVAEGFSTARRRLVREEEAVRRDFLDDLLGGRGEVAALVARAEQFGVRLAVPHMVALVEVEQEPAAVSRAALRAEEGLRLRHGGLDALVATRAGQLVCVVAQHDETGRQTYSPEQLGAAATAVTAEATGSPPRRVALGRSHAGARGVTRSLAEAQEALDVAERLELPEPIVTADQLLVYRLLLRDQAALGDLVESVLTPLTRARGGAEPLLDTLAAYFAAGGVAVEAARRLHLSVRAVTYRLERVRELTGLAPTNPSQRLALEVAVTGARLLGWPSPDVLHLTRRASRERHRQLPSADTS